MGASNRLDAEGCGGKFRPFHAAANLGESSFAGCGCVVGERREAAVVGGTKTLDGNVSGGFENVVFHLFRSFHRRVDAIGHADKQRLPVLQELTRCLENLVPIFFARELHVKAAGAELEEEWKQLDVIDIGAVRGPPGEIQSFPYFMSWYPRLTNEPAHKWFREQVRSAVRTA